MAVLKEVAAGGHYISVGLVLRDAVLKSKLLLNSEVWYGLTVKEIVNLEDLDKIYLRGILNAHPKVGLECLYFEMGKMPLKFHLLQRKMLYLWHILSVEKSESISRIYHSQKLTPNQ